MVTLAMGAAWASGINLYATVLLVGLLGTTGLVPLPDGLSPLTSPIVLTVAGVAYLIEFFADKIPGLDSMWDAVHTFIRIPAGAAMAAGARAAINTSPEPVTNWAASIFEDILVVGGLLLALFKPTVFLVFALVFFLVALWLLPKIWRGLRRLYRRITGASDAPDTETIADQRRGFDLSSMDRKAD